MNTAKFLLFRNKKYSFVDVFLLKKLNKLQHKIVYSI